MTCKLSRSRRYIAATTLTLWVAGVSIPAPALAETMAPAVTHHPTPEKGAPQNVGLMRELAHFRSRVALIQVALNQDQQSRSATVQAVGGMAGAETGIGAASAAPAIVSKEMPKSAGCCAGMMGKMGGAAPAPASTTMPSGLPGFPGASHLYHVGATGFFLDSPDMITLSVKQQAALNAIKEQSVAKQASAQRLIDQAEQELWMLTSSDQPDTPALEKKIREIENLKGEQRIAFIRSVGEAAQILTDDQRGALLGTGRTMGGTAPDIQPTTSDMGDM